MDIKFVDRDAVQASRKQNSKYRPLIEALDKLKVDKKAIEVSYKNQKHLNSMRTAVYQYNHKNNVKIKSRRNADNKKVYFYRAK